MINGVMSLMGFVLRGKLLNYVINLIVINCNSNSKLQLTV